jgi:signal transduction histidine kinase
VLRLSLLLVAVGFAGLFALYRMVAVALRFAEQRSNFVAAVSHELKTPLTAIRMYGEMLRDGLVSTDEKRAEYHRTITAESERLSRLIDNVLEFASSERGERPLALRIGPVGAEMARLCDALRPHAAEAGFTLELNAPSGLPAVAFDHDSVAQILVNLVDNALKYARGCSRRVVRIECVEEGGGVALRVRDFGPGVAPHEVGRVFDLFQRGESELTRTTRGTGLGLALVRSLSRRMGARASARNAEGGGFEVSVVFPRPAKS